MTTTQRIFALYIYITCSGIVWAETSEVTVSAATSLKNAFEEIRQFYESVRGSAKIIFNFGASCDLMKQIEGGAPVDVFASAAQKDLDDAEGKGLLLAKSRTQLPLRPL